MALTNQSLNPMALSIDSLFNDDLSKKSLSDVQFDHELCEYFISGEHRSKLQNLEAQRVVFIVNKLLEKIKLNQLFKIDDNTQDSLYLFLIEMGFKHEIISHLSTQKPSTVCHLLCQNAHPACDNQSNFDALLALGVLVDDLIKLLLPIARDNNCKREELITVHSLNTAMGASCVEVTMYLITLLINQDDDKAKLVLDEFFNDAVNEEALGLDYTSERHQSIILKIKGYLSKLRTQKKHILDLNEDTESRTSPKSPKNKA